MDGYIRKTRSLQLFLSVLSTAVLFVVIYMLFAPSASADLAEILRKASGRIEPVQQVVTDGSAYYNNVMPIALSDNAIRLTKPDNIDSITLSYKDNGEWVEITSENSSDLPADTSYQFKIEYDHISAEDLIAADCQMVYETLPQWLSPNESGVLLYGDMVVADIEVKDGRVIITFDKDWLEEQGSNVLHGTFKINGRVEWEKLPPDGGTAPPLPDFDINLDFGGDLASRYGALTVEKHEPELVEQDGVRYLKYELTVTSLENTTDIPDVYVIDTFTANLDYIEGYVGASGGIAEPEELYPQESSTVELQGDVQLKMVDGSMRWDLGNLVPNETRTLTYYAKIKPDYIDAVMTSQFKNGVKAFSGDNLKDIDSSNYAPKASASLKKVLDSYELDSAGTGMLNYSITISAPSTNSYTLDGLTVSDSFSQQFSDFIKITSISVDGKEVPVSGGSSLLLEDISIAPGETVTITYTAEATCLFASGSGDIELINYADVRSSAGKTLSSATHRETFEQNSWVRKVYGKPIENDQTIDIPSGDRIYDNDQNPADGRAGSFTVPKGSLRYQVILNEDGRWDLSASSLEDSFGDDYMHYCGYAQISVYKNPPASASGKPLSDEELLEKLADETPVETVWMDIDSGNGFGFTPSGLGLPEGEYTYLITYYAQPVGVDNIGPFEASNSFEIWGDVGYGNGAGNAWIKKGGMKITVSSVMKGGVDYDIEKLGWYYEPWPVYRAVDEEYDNNTANSDAEFEKDYKNTGALYWIIRLEGDIPECDYDDNGDSRTGYVKLKDGFIIRDVPTLNKSGLPFKRDSVLGVFVGDDSLDITQYSSYESFLKEEVESYKCKRLNGNPRNDKWFPTTAVDDPDYIWCANNDAMDGIIFPNGYSTDKGKALYIIIRTLPNSAPTADTTYQNDIYAGGVCMDTGEINYVKPFDSQPIYKESKGAFIYDAETGRIDRYFVDSNGGGSDWNPNDHMEWETITESGIYATWLLNVNYDGSMEETAYVRDPLPEGMELVYCDINWIGKSARDPYTKCERIPELDDDDSWIRLERVNTQDGTHIDFGTAITYYNPETRELRWKISNLKKAPALVKGGYEINLRIVCKVTDTELLLGSGEKKYINTAYSGELSGTGYVTIANDRSMNKQLLTDRDWLSDNNGVIEGELSKLPFSIEINPYDMDLCDGDTLPALIDELSPGLSLIEDSLEIRYNDGEPVRGCSFRVEENEGGGQTIIITGLPDNKKLTITYETRVNIKPKETLENIGNNAYWEGYPCDAPQVKGKRFHFNVDGNVFTKDPISITFTKLDSLDRSKKLEGAIFEIWEVDKNGELVGSEAIVTSDPTNADGYSSLEALTALRYNTVYCIIEKRAPNGYQIDETPHYFAVVSDPDKYEEEYKDSAVAELVDVWYESPEYSFTMINEKSPISVNKVFIDDDGAYAPTSGSYRFGLFESKTANQPIEILTIVYSEGGTKYYLDGVETDQPRFSDYEPELVYYVYELDESGAPIRNADICELQGISYHVKYYDSKGALSNRVTVNSAVKIENRTEDFAAEMPDSGGSGRSRYYLAGGIMILLSLVAGMLACSQRRRKSGA